MGRPPHARGPSSGPVATAVPLAGGWERPRGPWQVHGVGGRERVGGVHGQARNGMARCEILIELVLELLVSAWRPLHRSPAIALNT